ncbi:hypothetical protein [Sphingomonas aracearum]|uniref:Uncharacterized protein n=1 Tax=Sphingomonas aracearum TaxID=2283317 RepID=A0A369W1R2_9SPHN|nr:hypothetical protein [Sphingomonas aracearum]RDE07212.1 hypothetical protein DVW87_06135 [Sphingomonas aracearum]
MSPLGSAGVNPVGPAASILLAMGGQAIGQAGAIAAAHGRGSRWNAEMLQFTFIPSQKARLLPSPFDHAADQTSTLWSAVPFYVAIF